MVDARLADGSRVNAIIPPLALDGPVLSIRRFGRDPVTARNMIETVEHPSIGALKILGIPFKFSDTGCSVRRAPPTLGQHNQEILAEELGLDDHAIAELRQAKVI